MASTALGRYTVVFDPAEAGEGSKYSCRPRVMIQGLDVTKDVLKELDAPPTWDGDEPEAVHEAVAEKLKALLEGWTEEKKHRR